MKHSCITACATVIFGALLALSLLPQVQASTRSYPVTDFSAKLSGFFECTCTGAVYLYTINDLDDSMLSLVYMPGLSELKLDYNIYTPGVQLLGQYTIDVGLCEMYIGYSCYSIEADGMITPHPFQGTGTSGQPVG